MTRWRERLARAVVDTEAQGYRPIREGGDDRAAADPAALKPAAVLIAVTDAPAPSVLFVQRPDYMRSHAGQVAFPGGKIDADDGGDAVRAALREAEEELAIAPNAVEIIGRTDRYHSGSGYDIQPVIGVIPPDLAIVPCAQEVADWFAAPLDFILDPASFTEKEVFWRGARRRYYEAYWQDFRIWGVTAAIIRNLQARLDQAR
jgi:8-oxo-dGTP pyrophosphatase MutT (NUDIX family)